MSLNWSYIELNKNVMGNTVGRLSKVNSNISILLIELIPKLQQKLISKQDSLAWIQKMRELNYYSSQRTTLEVPVTTESPA